MKCNRIFRNNDVVFVVCFAENLGGGNAYHAEISGVLRAIEIGKQMNWNN